MLLVIGKPDDQQQHEKQETGTVWKIFHRNSANEQQQQQYQDHHRRHHHLVHQHDQQQSTSTSTMPSRSTINNPSAIHFLVVEEDEKEAIKENGNPVREDTGKNIGGNSTRRRKEGVEERWDISRRSHISSSSLLSSSARHAAGVSLSVPSNHESLPSCDIHAIPTSTRASFSFDALGSKVVCELKLERIKNNERMVRSRFKNTQITNKIAIGNESQHHVQDQNDSSPKKYSTIDSSAAGGASHKTPKALLYSKEITSSAAFIVAVVPTNLMRLLALWTQLECFVSNGQYKTIVIAAPEELAQSKRDFLDRFIQNAVESIPHLHNMHVVIKYFKNDRYDVGLWCDALMVDDSNSYLRRNAASLSSDNNRADENDDSQHFLSILMRQHSEFVLINDSIMAIRPNFTSVLGTLKEDKHLSMTSLNYSFLRGSEGDYSLSNKLWLESVFRAFNRDGIEKYMHHACVPASHPKFCPEEENAEKKKRCIVDSMEVPVADLFAPNQVKGLFPSDVPKDMVQSEALEHVYLWHSHFDFWRHELVDKMQFPAMKISNDIFVRRVANRAKGFFFKGTQFLDPMFLEDMQNMFA